MNSFSSRNWIHPEIEVSVLGHGFEESGLAIEAASMVHEAYFSTSSGVVATPLATT